MARCGVRVRAAARAAVRVRACGMPVWCSAACLLHGRVVCVMREQACVVYVPPFQAGMGPGLPRAPSAVQLRCCAGRVSRQHPCAPQWVWSND
jgi:hypothetical protein